MLHTLLQKRKRLSRFTVGNDWSSNSITHNVEFCQQGEINNFDLVRLLCVNPCKIYDVLNKGKIKIGYDADLTIIDLNKEFIISNNWIASKSKWTPFDNQKIKGMPIFTIVNGKIVMSENEIVSQPSGKVVRFRN